MNKTLEKYGLTKKPKILPEQSSEYMLIFCLLLVTEKKIKIHQSQKSKNYCRC